LEKGDELTVASLGGELAAGTPVDSDYCCEEEVVAGGVDQLIVAAVGGELLAGGEDQLIMTSVDKELAAGG
jgi:hypothetical protein